MLSYTGAGGATSDGNQVTYTNGGFVGEGVLEIKITDAYGGQSVAAVTLQNVAPVAAADQFSVSAGSTILHVLTNDQDVESDALTISAVGAASGGTVTSDGAEAHLHAWASLSRHRQVCLHG